MIVRDLKCPGCGHHRRYHTQWEEFDDWGSGSCTEPDHDGGYWPQDDGYGYPVYSVED